MKKTILAASLILSTCAVPVVAQPNNCHPRELVVEHLTNKFGESLQSMGVASADTLMEVFANESTGSWTILVTRPTGISCMVGSGQNYIETTNAVGDPL